MWKHRIKNLTTSSPLTASDIRCSNAGVLMAALLSCLDHNEEPDRLRALAADFGFGQRPRLLRYGMDPILHGTFKEKGRMIL